jgi:hypothetical protein
MNESLENKPLENNVPESTALEARIKASLEQSATYLDDDIQTRLQSIRRAALNQPIKKHWFSLNAWAPAASIAFCSVIAILVVLPSHQTSNPSSASADHTAMLELLENPDELDVMSDPDFYIWIDELENENGAHHAA